MKFKLVKKGRREREPVELRDCRNPDERAVSERILE